MPIEELATPKLTRLDQDSNGISPTKPLKVKQSRSELRISIVSESSEQSINTYQTAMEFEHSKKSSRTSNENESRENDNEKSHVNGLGIDKLDLADDTVTYSDPNHSYNSQSSFNYNDNPTPRVDHFQFTPDIYSQSSPRPFKSIEEDNDETPVIQSNDKFNPRETVAYNTTPAPQLRAQESPMSSGLPSNQLPADSVGTTDSFSIESASPIKIEASSTTSSLKKVSPARDRYQNEYTSLAQHDFSFASDAEDTTYSQESNQLHGLEQEAPNTANVLRTSPIRQERLYSNFTAEEEELTSLFLISLHAFDANSLELSQDSANCLSFDANDVAYVHTVDSSGWGEVTMIKTLQRGWVPVNFFTELVKYDSLVGSKVPLRRLLISSAKFLNNPLDNSDNGDSIFSIHHINDIRDGVKDLLERTDTLSRSTEIVKRRPIIRRIRKSLLADWYSLMIKADSYKHSKSVRNLETLQLMVFQVLKKSIAFLDIWLLESASLKKEQQGEKLDRLKKVAKPLVPNLEQPPFVKVRLNEIHNILFNYIGLLLGRLDMVEHNPAGCEILETITHQMILLLRELLFISKSCVLILNERNNKTANRNDDNLDTLLSLVSELVSSVKNFITKTIHEDYSLRSVKVKDGLYYYTSEGDDLIGIISRMTRSISSTVENCYKYLVLIGDFRLSSEKHYSDFRAIQISPEEFIKKCSIGMIKTLPADLRTQKRSSVKRMSRFSMIRSGAGLTTSGSNLLQEFLPDSRSFIRDSVFQPYLNDSNEEYKFDINDEIVRDSDDRLIGASFRALVYILTDELGKPDQFFVSTFFLTFKKFGQSDELIENLIERFNLENKFDDATGEFSSIESRLKNRRRLIVKMFQTWLESYWDYTNDYNLLPTLINFFNEVVSLYLPIESKKLIELCSKLTVMTPSKLKNKSTNNLSRSIFTTQSTSSNTNIQLVKRNTHVKHTSLLSHSSSVYSISSLNKELDDDDYIFEEYELAKINTNNRNSMLLPIINFNSSLLSKAQIHEIEELVLIYRRSLGTSQWIHEDYAHYYPIDLNKLLERWFEISQFQLATVHIDYNLVELNSFELAKQLTIIESKIFLSIKADELLNGNFTKVERSPNVQHSLLFTNLLCEYVLDSILNANLPEKKRILRLKSWLNVALSCYYLKNFNSLAAIIITLQNHLLSRLTEVWSGLPDKYQSLFNDLKKIIHPTNNYKGYRYKISKILDENDTKSSIPVVPYLNLFLQDLTFIQDGNKDYRNSNSFLRSKIINFDKFLRISRIISNLEFLQVGYDHQGVPKRLNKRNSIFSFNSSNALNDELSPILPLQEYIILELWKVHQLNINDNDRYWSLSKKLKE